ncbi:MAG: Ni/Fe hydrogenase subunit alpha [Gemmatimonadales bacterium]|jgi:NAD-reducing hydrogenase large subunit|nr:Ni/Fe hydrogenase subunit alpha [Candidatus Poribacteria bacterium]MBT3499669.1 Ni/Fe hydrogenase subunit alpha [Gemmatimonadales bacterium]
MAETITIEPVTRLEGHAKITIHLDDEGQVSDARFHIAEFRGFEKFCEGRPLSEMAGITARICGICPVSHLLASSKAGDAILGVPPPPAAVKLRRLMNLGQIIQSHALSFFHLSSPDLLFGMDSDPAKRNVFGIMEAEPDVARAGIRLRQFGQEIIALLGGQKVHPAWTVPGGVREPLSEEGRQTVLGWIPEVRGTAELALGLFKGLLEKFETESQVFGDFQSLFMSLVAEDGEWEHYDGKIRVVDSDGVIVADRLDAADYKEYIGEAAESWSYLKFPYYKPSSYPQGMFRVGPLARLNTCTHMGTPQADAELREYRDRVGKNGVVTSSLMYHYARLVEILACIERAERLMDDPDLLSPRVRVDAGINNLRGVGVSEAPRGTLFHSYGVDEHGIVQDVDLIIATGNNNLAMNRTVLQIAQHYITGPEIPEGVLNRIEAGTRCYDPCLSCSTHAVGKMPLHVTLHDAAGAVLDEARRG